MIHRGFFYFGDQLLGFQERLDGYHHCMLHIGQVTLLHVDGNLQVVYLANELLEGYIATALLLFLVGKTHSQPSSYI